mmetsp:Transcript_39758/g.100182  ORF Transcript_39758/g.100182 Transcript_39758/m.100182 type:complete len:310 (+) Transcript_39758:196-1125(+)
MLKVWHHVIERLQIAATIGGQVDVRNCARLVPVDFVCHLLWREIVIGAERRAARRGGPAPLAGAENNDWVRARKKFVGLVAKLQNGHHERHIHCKHAADDAALAVTRVKLLQALAPVIEPIPRDSGVDRQQRRVVLATFNKRVCHIGRHHRRVGGEVAHRGQREEVVASGAGLRIVPLQPGRRSDGRPPRHAPHKRKTSGLRGILLARRHTLSHPPHALLTKVVEVIPVPDDQCHVRLAAVVRNGRLGRGFQGLCQRGCAREERHVVGAVGCDAPHVVLRQARRFGLEQVAGQHVPRLVVPKHGDGRGP